MLINFPTFKRSALQQKIVSLILLVEIYFSPFSKSKAADRCIFGLFSVISLHIKIIGVMLMMRGLSLWELFIFHES